MKCPRPCEWGGGETAYCSRLRGEGRPRAPLRRDRASATGSDTPLPPSPQPPSVPREGGDRPPPQRLRGTRVPSGRDGPGRAGGSPPGPGSAPSPAIPVPSLLPGAVLRLSPLSPGLSPGASPPHIWREGGWGRCTPPSPYVFASVRPNFAISGLC